jgi:hypothetical protein
MKRMMIKQIKMAPNNCHFKEEGTSLMAEYMKCVSATILMRKTKIKATMRYNHV